MSTNMVSKDSIEINNEVEVVNSELSFQEQQAMAYGFLAAFYDRQNLGYSVEDYSYTDVTPEIIDIVNEMGEQIVTNTRIVTIAEVLYNIGVRVGLGATFVSASRDELSIDTIIDIISMVSISKDKLIEQKNIIMSNFFAKAVLIQILNARKQEIELRFLGFM
ncbi:hypothetical protein A9K75_06705 [Campylobacter fetus subsp. testudinum]|uniref:hypothetical protein n=1 Tax=Campylobacter fetus TaxID=196 RepID=UPI000818977B|nr:hypothetical protein [Campylobacter fetus]OCR99555.1 hypothetical protein A9K75_06705 [Campylobacter fetus subsp. testudinum]